MRKGLTKLDAWLGRTLFIPIVIKLCQHLGCTQYRFHRVGWFIGALVAFGFTHSLVAKILFGLIAVIRCILAGASGDHYPVQSWRWFRLLLLGFLVYDLFGLHFDLQISRPIYDLIFLFAEYAALIRTIPPLEAKEPKRVFARARA